MRYKVGELVDSISEKCDFKTDKIIFLNTGDIEDGKIVNNNCYKISDLPGQAKKKIKNGDILFSEIRPKNKRYALVENIDETNYVVSTKLMVLRNKDSKVLNMKYFYYFLTSPKMLRYLQSEAEARSGTFPQITFKDNIYPITINLPSLAEQKKIVKNIDSIVNKIKNNQKINTNLLELTALLWKNKFSLYNETTTIESYGEIISGGTPSKKKIEYYIDGTISWITPKDLSNSDSLYINKGALNITDIGLNQSSAKLLKKGTILYSSRAPIGYIAIAARELSTNQGFKSIQPHKQKYTEFLYHLMKFITPNIINSASGSTFKEISMRGMKAIKVPKVSEKDIESYHFIVKPLFDKIRLLEQENIKLKKLKNALLVKLLN